MLAEVYFVTRMKENAVYEVKEEVRVPINPARQCQEICVNAILIFIERF